MCLRASTAAKVESTHIAARIGCVASAAKRPESPRHCNLAARQSDDGRSRKARALSRFAPHRRIARCCEPPSVLLHARNLPTHRSASWAARRAAWPAQRHQVVEAA